MLKYCCHVTSSLVFIRIKRGQDFLPGCGSAHICFYFFLLFHIFMQYVQIIPPSSFVLLSSSALLQSFKVCFLVSLSLPACFLRFTPDFTSSWVIRDLTLVTSRGTSFPFTLNVTLPHHMLPLCAQVVPGPSWEETFWVVTLIFTWLVL